LLLSGIRDIVSAFRNVSTRSDQVAVDRAEPHIDPARYVAPLAQRADECL
jgi:hypothetical protein